MKSTPPFNLLLAVVVLLDSDPHLNDEVRFYSLVSTNELYLTPFVLGFVFETHKGLPCDNPSYEFNATPIVWGFG